MKDLALRFLSFLGVEWAALNAGDRLSLLVGSALGVVGLIVSVIGLVVSVQQYQLAKLQQALLDEERSRRAELSVAIERTEWPEPDVYDIVVRNTGRIPPTDWSWQLVLPSHLMPLLEVNLNDGQKPRPTVMSGPNDIWMMWSAGSKEPIYRTAPFLLGRMKLLAPARKDQFVFGWTITSNDGEFPDGEPGYARIP